MTATTTSAGRPGTTLSASRPEGSASGTLTGIASTFDPASVRFEAALMRFDSCDALLGYFRAEALAHVGPYGLNGGPTYYPGPWLARSGIAEAGDVMSTTTAATTTVPQGMGEGSNGNYSTTNVQVAGVDEPDTIKTDGERILTVVNGILYYVEVDGAAGRLAGCCTLPEGWNHRFFMAGDRALVFSQGDGYAVPLIEGDARDHAHLERAGHPGPRGRPVQPCRDAGHPHPAARGRLPERPGHRRHGAHGDLLLSVRPPLRLPERPGRRGPGARDQQAGHRAVHSRRLAALLHPAGRG